MTTFRISEVAALMGVSTDTVRRWTDSGRLPATREANGHRSVDGAALARFARELAEDPDPNRAVSTSARNSMRGIVTHVVRDTVMAQVEMQCGPFRIVSLMSREAADDLHLEPGVLAIAMVKSTNVIVELPDPD
ncbi:TOBE domain-containing protein [Sporichthya sp.]|uniref:TOBE domain-containing protein n=1 Tax=Sporichthya sp. TaxID=65475 RepID=UPI0017A01BE4|nr:TOBE domain-containing protein [Sporichthya sp.]MBA3741811.1 helix-turn-helix transcriptional regulator [Sporichthya sp.]